MKLITRFTGSNTSSKYRSSYGKCSIKIVVLKNFAIFTRKRLCWSLFLIKLLTWRTATLLKRDYNAKTLISKEHLWTTTFEKNIHTTLPMMFSVFGIFNWGSIWRRLVCSKFESLMLLVATLKIKECYRKSK